MKVSRINLGRVVIAMALSLTTWVGCSSPEEQVAARVEEARAALEEGDLSALRGMVAEQYEDEQGNDRETVLATVAYYVRVEGGVYAWTRIREIRMLEPNRAEVRLLVALASGPIEQPQDLTRVRAELHRFVLQLVKQPPGGWQLTHAQWTPASLSDFL
jgi:hypothetical protein